MPVEPGKRSVVFFEGFPTEWGVIFDGVTPAFIVAPAIRQRKAIIALTGDHRVDCVEARLGAMRRPSENYSDVILRLVGTEGARTEAQ